MSTLILCFPMDLDRDWIMPRLVLISEFGPDVGRVIFI